MKRLTTAAVLAALCACGVEEPRPAVAHEPAGGAEPVVLDQVRSYKQQIVEEAMRGLLYDTGRVELDPTVAPQLVAATDPSAARLELERGHELLALNRRNDALAAMTRAVLLAPEEPATYEGLGDALIHRRKYPEAGAAFRTGLELAPESAALHLKLADVLVRADDRAGAIEELRTAARLAPEDPTAAERLAIQLYYTDQPEPAWAEVHRAESLGHTVPPQFRALLAARQVEPATTKGE